MLYTQCQALLVCISWPFHGMVGVQYIYGHQGITKMFQIALSSCCRGETEIWDNWWYVEVYCVDCSNGTCSCRNFMKLGYCKHLLYAHALLNEDSDYIIIDHWFKYKGNTEITKRQRGRVKCNCYISVC